MVFTPCLWYGATVRIIKTIGIFNYWTCICIPPAMITFEQSSLSLVWMIIATNTWSPKRATINTTANCNGLHVFSILKPRQTDMLNSDASLDNGGISSIGNGSGG